MPIMPTTLTRRNVSSKDDSGQYRIVRSASASGLSTVGSDLRPFHLRLIVTRRAQV